MKKTKNLFLIILGIIIAFTSCKKSAFLDANNDQRQIIPKSIQDFQEILNNQSTSVPGLVIAASDDYHWLTNQLNSSSYSIETLNMYIWNDDIWYGGVNLNWNLPYNEAFKANIVLDGLNKIIPRADQQTEWNNARGAALFYRSFYFYQLLQLFAPVYDISTAANQLGIPLRVNANSQESLKRATLQESYDRVLNDLKEAKELLPNKPKFKSQPSAHAVAALLARVYLAMGDFNNSLMYASECLGYSNVLLDYNTETIERYNKEVIFSCLISTNGLITRDDGFSPTAIDVELIDAYKPGDLRINLFYGDNALGGKYFKGSYEALNGRAINIFGGLATDEVYLIRAECYARAGNIAMALADLNTLMIKRWKNDGSWLPFTASSSNETLQKILLERRKELVFRGLRWTDLRRLNKLGANIAIKRTLDDGTVITLPPNSPKYTYLIPPNVMSFHPDWLQNPR